MMTPREIHEKAQELVEDEVILDEMVHAAAGNRKHDNAINAINARVEELMEGLEPEERTLLQDAILKMIQYD